MVDLSGQLHCFPPLIWKRGSQVVPLPCRKPTSHAHWLLRASNTSGERCQDAMGKWKPLVSILATHKQDYCTEREREDSGLPFFFCWARQEIKKPPNPNPRCLQSSPLNIATLLTVYTDFLEDDRTDLPSPLHSPLHLASTCSRLQARVYEQAAQHEFRHAGIFTRPF